MRISIVPLLFACVWVTLCSSPGAENGKVDFNYDIRPIISSKCFHCHGPDEGARKAKLRLDLREGALKEHEGVRAIVPGDVKASELVLRIESADQDEVMPPPKEGERLTKGEVALLKRWVAEGAEYKEHWAWTKPHRIDPLPDLRIRLADWEARRPVGGGELRKSAADLLNWPRNPVDAFVLARMLREGLTPSPEADRHALIRRLSLDLIGLPPTMEEVSAFVNDASPDYYEKAVDRILASPRFGEKWARMWLDLARYADSTGYGSDGLRLNIWPYRDWVIQAFNRNLPYDQFTVDQIAGDLRPQPTEEQMVATAFHRNTMTNIEGGTVREEYRVAAVKDRIATTAQVWMGLTMQCAQCHTHKFDPISQTEYYQFFAIFNQTEDADRRDETPTMPLPSAAEKERIESLKREIGALKQETKASSPALETELRAWEEKMRQPVEWTALAPDALEGSNGAKLTSKEDRSIMAEGGTDGPTTYTITARLPGPGVTAFRLEALTDDALPAKGPGRAVNGNAAVTELSAALVEAEARPTTARYLRIEAPGANRILSLAEVQVFRGSENVAAKGQATQSSTDYEGPAKLAIDGKTNGDFRQGKSVTHTKQGSDPWWEVDLGAEMPIDRVLIWNRTDEKMGGRLANSKVLLLDGNRQPVKELPITAAPEPKVEFFLSGVRRTVALRHASADFSQSGWDAERAIDGNRTKENGWAFAPKTGEPHAVVFEAEQPVNEEGAVVKFTIEQNYGANHSLGRFRLSTTSAHLPVRELPADVKSIVATIAAERTPAAQARLLSYFRPLSQTHERAVQRLAAKEKELATIQPVAVPVMRELTAAHRRESHFLHKGNYLAPGDKLEPALPAAFSVGFQTQGAPDRMAVAQWLISPENPLTARVAVNRFWAQLFGVGLVETEEDFGSQGALPSHPELLDWLAVAFASPKDSDAARVGLGWDMKGLLKLIVTSATYRQSSRVSPTQLEKDSRNRFLSHYPRRRLEAELVRDEALALSGLLSAKIGGPSVYPPQPEGLWRVAFNGKDNAYVTSKGEDRYRRGIYTVWRRSMPYPSMATFDAPSRESCTLRRTPTNTPLQAFVTLNDPCFVECAQAFARRIIREGGSDSEARIRWALSLVLSRPAEEKQIAALQQLLASELAHYREDLPAATKLAVSETQPLSTGLDPAEVAAWTVVANVLLNLDGVLTKG